ncbi:MAG TPA: hypothetical protein VGX23_28885 [Actinocrinis sp.]|nr:hypothetical protein [Actinocrinis sp.]
MGNLDFTNQPGIAWYCVFLLISGVLLVVSSLVPALAKANRSVNFIVGLLFLAYGGYVTFIQQSGTVIIFIYAFILPFILIANSVKAWNAGKGIKPTPQQQAMLAQQRANQAQYAAWQQAQAQSQGQMQAPPQYQPQPQYQPPAPPQFPAQPGIPARQPAPFAAPTETPGA